MKVLRLFAFALLGALTLTACGATVSTVSTVETVDTVEFAPTSAFLASSVQRVEAVETHRFESFMEIDSFMAMGSRTEPMMVGVVAGERSRLDMDGSVLFNGVGDELLPPGMDTDDLSMSMVVDGDVVYLNAPIFGATFGEIPSGMFGDVDLSWVDVVANGWGELRLDTVGLTDIQSQAFNTGLNGDQTLAMLEAVTTVIDGGPSQVRGVDTNTLIASTTFAAFIEASGIDPATLQVGGPSPEFDDILSTPIDIEVHIDEAGLVRRVVLVIDMGVVAGGGAPMQMWNQTDYFDFGADLSVQIPTDAVDITDGFVSLIDPSGG